MLPAAPSQHGHYNRMYRGPKVVDVSGESDCVAPTRFAAEAGDDGMVSGISPPARAHLLQAVGERRIAEIRKSAAAGRDVERPVAAVRHLSLPRRPAHRHHGLDHGGDALGDVAKAVDLAGCDVERPPTAMLDHAADDFGHVIDQHVIAPLLAFAED